MKKLILLFITVVIIILFDIFYTYISISYDINYFFLNNKFEYIILSKIFVNGFLFIITILSLKYIGFSKNAISVNTSKINILYLIPLAILVGIGTNEVGVLITNLFTGSFEDFGHSEKISESISLLDNNYKKIIFLIVIGFIVPIIEEFYMRLFAYSILREKFNIIIATILNTIIFLFFHLNPSIFPFIIISNIIICLSYEYTKNILIPVLIHITINTYSLSWNL